MDSEKDNQKRHRDNEAAFQRRLALKTWFNQTARDRDIPLLMKFSQEKGLQDLKIPVYKKPRKNVTARRLDPNEEGMGFTIQFINTNTREWVEAHTREDDLYLKAPSDTNHVEDGIVMFLDHYFFLVSDDYSKYRILSINNLFKMAPHRFIRRSSKGNKNRIDVNFTGIKLIPTKGSQDGFYYDQPNLFIAILHLINKHWENLR